MTNPETIAAILCGAFRPSYANEETRVCPFCGLPPHVKMCAEQRAALGVEAVDTNALIEAHDDAQDLIEELRLQLDEARTLLATLCTAAHNAHALLYHYDLAPQPNGVNWGPVEMLKTEQIDELWAAICAAQPEFKIAPKGH